MIRQAITEPVYRRLFHGDVIPFAFPFEGDPVAFIGKENYDYIMHEWSKVLKAVDRLCKHIALCSKKTQDRYSQLVFNDTSADAKALKKRLPKKNK